MTFEELIDMLSRLFLLGKLASKIMKLSCNSSLTLSPQILLRGVNLEEICVTLVL